mmetsp:Transcript_62745/g.130431  ORF Transcript_62745/g.130431 Transcript_62745/m.130431 type:complete len:273 (-) Transcript_62745:4099-4917(-)
MICFWLVGVGMAVACSIVAYTLYTATRWVMHRVMFVITIAMHLFTFCQPIQPDRHAFFPRQRHHASLKAMVNKIGVSTVCKILMQTPAAAGTKRKFSSPMNAYRSVCKTTQPPLKKGEMWMVADSGVNKHFIPKDRRKEFMFKTEPVRDSMGGLMGPEQAETTHFGIFSEETCSDKHTVCTFTSVAFAVKGATVTLFSEIQTLLAGNTMIHEGHPETGTHGIKVKSAHFIPYYWDAEEMVFLIKVRAPSAHTALHAWTLDPYDMLCNTTTCD